MADNARMQDLQQENRDLQKALQAIEGQLDATLGKYTGISAFNPYF